MESAPKSEASWHHAAVLADVTAERRRQFAKHGDQSDVMNGTGPTEHSFTAICGPDENSHAAGTARAACQRLAAEGRVTFAAIALEEVAEAFAESEPDKLYAEVIQCAAVFVQWAEALRQRHPELTLSASDILNTANGIVDLRTGKLRPAEVTRAEAKAKNLAEIYGPAEIVRIGWPDPDPA